MIIVTRTIWQWTTTIDFVLLWCQPFTLSFFSVVSIFFLHAIYVRISSLSSHIQKHNRAIEKVKSDKSSILSLFFVFKRQQIEKHSSRSLYVMKLTYHLWKEKENKQSKKKQNWHRTKMDAEWKRKKTAQTQLYSHRHLQIGSWC